MKKKAIYTFAKWQVKEEHLQVVLELLPTLAEQSSREEGNLLYKVHQSLSDTHTILLYEGYKDEAALEEHRSSAHFKEIVIRQIVPLLDNRSVEITHALFAD